MKTDPPSPAGLTRAGSGGPEWMSSHPNPGNRIEYLNDAIDKKYSSHVGTGRMGEEAFQQVVGQPVAMMRIDWSQPSMWCLTCRLKESQQKNRPSAAALSN